MCLFGSKDFPWEVMEDKILFLMWVYKDSNALIFLKLELDGFVFNIDWDLTPDIGTGYPWKLRGVHFFCLGKQESTFELRHCCLTLIRCSGWLTMVFFLRGKLSATCDQFFMMMITNWVKQPPVRVCNKERNKSLWS